MRYHAWFLSFTALRAATPALACKHAPKADPVPSTAAEAVYDSMWSPPDLGFQSSPLAAEPMMVASRLSHFLGAEPRYGAGAGDERLERPRESAVSRDRSAIVLEGVG